MDNPYLRDIKIKNQICGSAAITRRRIIEPDTLMFFDEKNRDPETFKIQ